MTARADLGDPGSSRFPLPAWAGPSAGSSLQVLFRMIRLGIYDQTARYTAKMDPPGLLRWLLPGVDPNLVFTRWLDTQTIPFPGGPDLRCDTVAELTPADHLG